MKTPDAEQKVATWDEHAPPVYPDSAWFEANHSREEWQVFVQNGTVWAKPYSERTPELMPLPFRLTAGYITAPPQTAPGTSTYAKEKARRVSDGWILWTNHGEWGGRVDWFSPDGTRHYKISRDQITAYAQTPDGLFAVQGLEHMGIRRGTLLQLVKNAGGKWEARTLVDLKDAPYALLTEPDGAFLIVTSTKLLRVRVAPQKTVTPLVENTFWWGMYPNSLAAAPNGEYFIGMRGGVVRVSREAGGTYRVRWLTPPPAVRSDKNPNG